MDVSNQQRYKLHEVYISTYHRCLVRLIRFFERVVLWMVPSYMLESFTIIN